VGLEYLQRRRLHNLLGPGNASRTREIFFFLLFSRYLKTITATEGKGLWSGVRAEEPFLKRQKPGRQKRGKRGDPSSPPRERELPTSGTCDGGGAGCAEGPFLRRQKRRGREETPAPSHRAGEREPLPSGSADPAGTSVAAGKPPHASAQPSGSAQSAAVGAGRARPRSWPTRLAGMAPPSSALPRKP